MGDETIDNIKIPCELINLRVFRMAFQIRLKDLAQAYEPSGCRPEFLSNILNGRKKVSPHVLGKVRGAFAKVVRENELKRITKT